MRINIQGPLAGTPAGKIAEEAVRACVHCGMCNATCPTYQFTGDELDGPRGRIYLIKQALEGEPVSRLTQTHLDRCLACRACETTCPSGVDYHRLLDIGRTVVATKADRPVSQRLFRAALRAVVPHAGRLRLLLTLGRLVKLALPRALARKIPRAHKPGSIPQASRPRRMALLAGCAQAATAPHFNAATQRVFDKIGISLIETPGVGCCGALSAHLEAPGEARRQARRNLDAWTGALDDGAEGLVINASGCAAFVRDYGDLFLDDPAYAAKARRVIAALRDPIMVLADTAPKAVRSPIESRIVFHEPCTLRNGPALGGAVVSLLQSLGYATQPVEDPHLCCGSAGAYALMQPDFANRLRTRKLAALVAGGPKTVYTANIGCWLHLAEASPIPVRHWIEAVDDVT